MADKLIGKIFQYGFLGVAWLLLPVLLPCLLIAIGVIAGLVIQYASIKVLLALREEKKREAAKSQEGD